MKDDDLDLEPMDKGRFRPLVIGVVVVAAAAGIAMVLNGKLAGGRRRESLEHASTAWNQLQRCLVGEAPQRGERVAARVRRIEIGRPAAERAAEPAARARYWPYRCASPAGVLTHALFNAGASDPKLGMLQQLASQAATALENGDLHTGERDGRAYLDELFEAARQAELPPGAAATGPLPPAPAAPLAPLAMSALFAGSEAAGVVATDPVPARTLRVVVGQTPRRVCVFAPDAAPERALATARCEDVPFANAPTTVELLPSTDDGPALLRVRRAAGTASDLYAAGGASRPLFEGGVSGFAGPNGTIVTLREAPAAASTPTAPTAAPALPRWQLVDLATPTAPRFVDLAFPPSAGEPGRHPMLVWNQVLATAPSTGSATVVAGGDAGTTGSDAAATRGDAGLRTDAGAGAGASEAAMANLAGAALPAADATGPLALADLGRVPAPRADDAVSACRTEEVLAVAVRSADDRVGVTFFANGRWSPPAETHAPPATLTCSGTTATLTWFETSPNRLLQQARCTPTGCTSAHAPLPEFDGTPLVTDLDGRVLFLTSSRERGGLRMRLAPLATVYQTDEVVIVDDGEHRGLAATPPTQVFVRGGTAVVFLTSTSLANETYAVRIDRAGGFSAVRPVEPR